MMDSDKTKGLFSRYCIAKTDGSAVDPAAEYFVMRLDYGGGDEKHVTACRKAMHPRPITALRLRSDSPAAHRTFFMVVTE